MAIYGNTFEGGTSGAAVTAGNSGGVSGQPFSAVTTGVRYTTDASHGSMAAEVDPAVGTAQNVRWAYTGNVMLFRVYAKFSNIDEATVLQLGFLTGSAQALVRPAGTVQLYSGSNLATSVDTLSTNTWYRFELYARQGTGSGEVRLAVYEGDSTTPWWDSGAGNNSLTIPEINAQRAGRYTVSTAGVTWDSMGLKTGADAVWGAWPYAPPVGAPVLSVARPAENLVDLRGSTSGDGSALTYPTPTHVSGPTLAVTNLATGLWLFSQDGENDAVYTVTARQEDNQTASQSVTIAAQAVLAPSENVSAPLRILDTPPSSNWG